MHGTEDRFAGSGRCVTRMSGYAVNGCAMGRAGPPARSLRSGCSRRAATRFSVWRSLGVPVLRDNQDPGDLLLHHLDPVAAAGHDAESDAQVCIS